MKKVIAIQMFEDQNQGFAEFKESMIALTNDGFSISAFTTQRQADMLAGIKGIDLTVLNTYKGAGKIIKIINFLSLQIRLFVNILKMTNAGDVVYISSLWCIMPALAAKIKNAVLICHFNSAQQMPSLLNSLSKFIVNKYADQVIFNSVNLKDSMALTVAKQAVIYNAPSHNFIQNIKPASQVAPARFHVLMIARSQATQSINKLIELAVMTPLCNFELVLTDRDRTNIPEYLLKYCPTNLYVSTGQNKHEFYQRANVMVDLSSKAEMVPGADVNILQAMYYGIPVVVPADSGMQEFIIAGKHGIAINSDHIMAISQTINDIKDTVNLHERLSDACLSQAKLFNPHLFGAQFTRLFNGYKARPYDNLIQLFGTAYLNKDVSVFGPQVA